MQVNFTPFDKNKGFYLPTYANQGDAGLDLKSINTENIIIKPHERKLIDTNISIQLPDGYEAQIRSRSGLALKKGVFVLNSPGTIDPGYRGSVGIILFNTSNEDFIVEPGMKVAQMIINKYESIHLNLVDELDDSDRGSGGFGSTGV